MFGLWFNGWRSANVSILSHGEHFCSSGFWGKIPPRTDYTVSLQSRGEESTPLWPFSTLLLFHLFWLQNRHETIQMLQVTERGAGLRRSPYLLPNALQGWRRSSDRMSRLTNNSSSPTRLLIHSTPFVLKLHGTVIYFASKTDIPYVQAKMKVKKLTLFFTLGAHQS